MVLEEGTSLFFLRLLLSLTLLGRFRIMNEPRRRPFFVPRMVLDHYMSYLILQRGSQVLFFFSRASRLSLSLYSALLLIYQYAKSTRGAAAWIP